MEKKTKQMGKETMKCKCNVCSKYFHIEEAKFCTRCGTELDLSMAVSKMDRYHH